MEQEQGTKGEHQFVKRGRRERTYRPGNAEDIL
jgi:hypothetical protein